MSSSATPVTSPSDRPAEVGPGGERRELIESHEPRNIIVLAAFQVMLRVGWIFKTESVIMPAVVDAISGAGWVRGCLPVLNRVGQSLPPLFLAERLRNSRLKRRWLFTTTLMGAGIFAILAIIWATVDEKRQPLMTVGFLMLYTLFFGITGVNQLAIGTVQGKLVRAHRRGRLMTIYGIIGSIGAVTAAAILLTRWLAIPENRGYTWIFAFVAGGFVVAALSLLALFEPPDEYVVTPRRTPRHHFSNAWQVYRHDRSFRRAANVSMLFIGSVLLFPHYRWLAADQLGTSSTDMVGWVIAQNIGVGLFSPVFGTIADRHGNRIVMRLEIFLGALVPLLAILMASGLVPHGGDYYWIVFVFLGLVPVTIRTIINYTLELADETEQPRYLSTMHICLAIPFVVSPLAGLWLDVFPDESKYTGVCVLFGAVSLLMTIGGFLTFRMAEPRHLPIDVTQLPDTPGESLS
ncbi:MAG: MFS transporter [Planctomycetaceae bacterium]|nr:MFS transporter [Planctomycetaceae bacterium]